MWTLVGTNHTFIPDFLLFLIIILCGSWSLPTITLPLYLKLLAPICQLWSVLTTTVHAFVNEFTPSPAGWRRSQKPGSIRPAHGELPSQVGVLEYINIIQGVFFNWASPLDWPPPNLLGLAPPKFSKRWNHSHFARHLYIFQSLGGASLGLCRFF